MNIYLAMWVRGPKGDKVSSMEIEENKALAEYWGQAIQSAVGSKHTIIIPHVDERLNQIDEQWVKDRDVKWVEVAMSRCYFLLDSCQMIILLSRHHLSEGMRAELEYAKSKGLLIYEAEELTNEVLEDIKYTVLDYEVQNTSCYQEEH